jgi:hypothetical protein
MDIDKDDLAVLSARMTKEEMDRVHRLLHEWGVGPADNFPVQFTLLTSAQLLAAASVPKAIADGRKLLEQHLAEYRRQTKLLLDGFAGTGEQQQAETRAAIEAHAKAIQTAAEQIQAQLGAAEKVAGRVKTLMDGAVSEWNGAKARMSVQCERLEEVSNDLQNRFAWQTILWWAVSVLLAFGLGCCLAVTSIHSK